MLVQIRTFGQTLQRSRALSRNGLHALVTRWADGVRQRLACGRGVAGGEQDEGEGDEYSGHGHSVHAGGGLSR